MPDSLPLVTGITQLVESKPMSGPGHRIEDPAQFAVDIVGIVAPIYQTDIDEALQAQETAEALAASRNEELIGLRADVDRYRTAVAAIKGALEVDDIISAKAAASTL